MIHTEPQGPGRSTELFRTDIVRVGAFRCPVTHPRFGAGPTPLSMVVFPRTTVWIDRPDAASFVAGPKVATIYNAGDRYRRRAVSPEGDIADWFAVSQPVALEMAQSLDPSAMERPDRPFRSPLAPSDSGLYFDQRVLFERIGSGGLDPLEVEEAVLRLVARVLARAAANPESKPWSLRGAAEARRDLAARAQSLLAGESRARFTVSELALRLGTSPFHLCRVFRQATGTTLHRYRVDLRLRQALDRLGRATVDLSELAFELGFASHSHFSAQFRRAFGISPSVARRATRIRPLPT